MGKKFERTYEFPVPTDWEEFTLLKYVYQAGATVTDIRTATDSGDLAGVNGYLFQSRYTIHYKHTDIKCLATFERPQMVFVDNKNRIHMKNNANIPSDPVRHIEFRFYKGSTVEFDEFTYDFNKAYSDDVKNSKETSDTASETPFDKVDAETRKKIQTRVFRRFLAIINNDPNSVEMYLTPRGEICAVTPKLGIGDIYEMFGNIGIDIATATDFTSKEAKHVTLAWKDAWNVYSILDDVLNEKDKPEHDYEVFGERGISFERLYDALVGDVYANKTVERVEEIELEQEEQEEKKAVERERERDREIYRSR